MRALPDARHEYFPDPGCSQRTHGVTAPVPLVEIPDHADALRVRRPDGEARPVHAVDGPQLRAKLFVDPAFVALSKKKEIRLAQRRQKRVRVPRAAGAIGFVRDDEVVGVHALRGAGDAFEHTRLVHAFQFKARFVFLVNGADFDRGGIGDEGAHDKAGAIAQDVHAQQFMGRTVLRLDQTSNFILGQYHVGRTLTECSRRDTRKA